MARMKKPGPVGGLVPGMGRIKHLYYKLNLSIFQQVVLPLVTPEGMAALIVLLCQEVQA